MLKSRIAVSQSFPRTILALAICSSSVTGCSRIWKDPNDTSSSSQSKPGTVGEGATIGALSGAALGGGVGAIIGSTSGHLGEGVAVGALAGGVAGAGVGAAVYDYKAKQAAKRDSIRDEEYQREEQRRDYNTIKDSLGDEYSGHSGRMGTAGSGTSFTTSRVSSGGYGIRENYFGNPQAKPFRPSGMSHSRNAGSQNHGPIPASVRTAARSGSTAVRPVRQTWDRVESPSKPASPSRAMLKNTALQETSHNSRLKAAPEEDLLGTGIDVPPVRTVGRQGIEGVAGLPAAAQAVPETAKSVTGKIDAGNGVEGDAVVAKQIGKLPPAEGSSNCIQAEKEAVRALNATSDADRLFYIGRASRLCPTSDTFQVELGKVFAKIGKVQEAKSAFKKAAELNPQNDVARDELSILENSTQ